MNQSGFSSVAHAPWLPHAGFGDVWQNALGIFVGMLVNVMVVDTLCGRITKTADLRSLMMDELRYSGRLMLWTFVVSVTLSIVPALAYLAANLLVYHGVSLAVLAGAWLALLLRLWEMLAMVSILAMVFISIRPRVYSGRAQRTCQ